MHKIVLVNEPFEWAVAELCRITGVASDVAREAVAKARCVLCNRELGEKKVFRMAALPRGVDFCCQWCTHRLASISARVLSFDECVDGYKGECHRCFRALVNGAAETRGRRSTTEGGKRAPARHKAFSGNGQSRTAKEDEPPGLPKRKDPPRRRLSPGRKIKKMFARLLRR